MTVNQVSVDQLSASPFNSEVANDLAVVAPVPKLLKKSCGGIEMQLHAAAATVNGDSSKFSDTTLQLLNVSGRKVSIENPSEMKDYTAIGLGCAVAAYKSEYFVVQYGELDSSCSFCEWFYAYDLTEKQLTHSGPPILEDDSLPAAQQLYSNNQEYESSLKKIENGPPVIPPIIRRIQK